MLWIVKIILLLKKKFLKIVFSYMIRENEHKIRIFIRSYGSYSK